MSENKPSFHGKIYYASQDAKRDRLYKDGSTVTIESYKNYRILEDNFMEINFNDSGTSYVHLQLESQKEKTQ